MPGPTCLLITGRMKLKPMKLMAPSDPIAALNAGNISNLLLNQNAQLIFQGFSKLVQSLNI